MTQAALLTTDIHKSFGGVPVLKGVSLALQPGTVTALAGENGAGKSVFMKISSGQIKPDSGMIVIEDQALTHADPGTALKLGVAIVPQELAPITEMTVYENIFLGREIRTALGLLDRSAMIREARDMMQVFELDLDPKTKMRDLSVGMCQLVEIVKNTNKGAKVVLLDEPTSSIDKQEVGRLYRVVNKLRDQGVAMLYTTHKMEEIRALADRVVVLRDGNLILDEPLSALTDDAIVTAMIGRELEDLFPRRHEPSAEVRLRLADVQVAGYEAPINLTVKAGEIVGLAGLVGAGRTELLEAIFGVRRVVQGRIEVSGRALAQSGPRAAIKGGMALVPEDRKGAGAVLSMSILHNGALPRLSNYTTGGVVQAGSLTRAIAAVMESVRLRSRGLSQLVGTLSGGNQQKVVLARWLTSKVDVLLLDEPTRGVDVGARSEIYRIITDLAAGGMAVLMASSDMAEVLSLSHRAVVMREGAIVGELSRGDLGAPDAQDVIFRLGSGLTGSLDSTD